MAKSRILLNALLFSFFALVSVCHGQVSNIWSSAGQMTQARTGAAAVLLQDGRILITGGTDVNGVPIASAEFFNPATGGFSAAPAMNVARANHAAIVLASGDVLVTGGLTPGGGYSDTAEIYSVSGQQWTLLNATLGSGLIGHAMALLSDGNVLIAGGTTTSGPVSSLLLFNLSDESITPAGSLLTARTNAAAAATPDGRVLIAGGTESTATFWLRPRFLPTALLRFPAPSLLGSAALAAGPWPPAASSEPSPAEAAKPPL